MDKAQEYVNKRTYSILKNNIYWNNRDVVATIVYNELLHILKYCDLSDDIHGTDVTMLKTMLHKLKSQFYTDIPMKLKPYCVQHSNGYFRGLYDPYVLALLSEKAEPWVWEDDAIQLLEIQEETKYITNDNSKNKGA